MCKLTLLRLSETAFIGSEPKSAAQSSKRGMACAFKGATFALADNRVALRPPFHLQLLPRCKRHNQAPLVAIKSVHSSLRTNLLCFLFLADQLVLTFISSIILLSCWEDCHPNPTWQSKFLALIFST